MAHLFAITDEIKDIARSAFDDMLAHNDDGGLGRSVKLVFPSKLVPCPDPACQRDPIGNKTGNIWTHGGRVAPHVNSKCVMCNGNGTIAEEVSETVTMLMEWDIKQFQDLIPESDKIRAPYSIVRTKFMVDNLHKVLKCNYAIMPVPISAHVEYRFKRLSGAISPNSIIQDRYFYCIWEQI